MLLAPKTWCYVLSAGAACSVGGYAIHATDLFGGGQRELTVPRYQSTRGSHISNPGQTQIDRQETILLSNYVYNLLTQGFKTGLVGLEESNRNNTKCILASQSGTQAPATFYLNATSFKNETNLTQYPLCSTLEQSK